MSTKSLSILLPALLATVAFTAFIGVGYVQARTQAEADNAPSLTQYLASYARKERAEEIAQPETVAALGDVPGVDAEAEVAAEIDPEAVTDVETAKADVVSRDQTPPSSWFRRDKETQEVRVEFTCVAGVGGSKICTAETVKR